MAAEPAHSLGRDQELDDVVAAYLEAAESDVAPNRQEWLARYPHLAEELLDFFADQDRFDTLVSPLRHGSGVYPSQTRTSPFVPPRSRHFGDYELLEEIARGGMGVVYKARQISLNRVVALKMILSGHLASAADVQRFRQEALNAASLDHPNIVPIYEVGEHEGQHYFSMKLIEGGHLTSFSDASQKRFTDPTLLRSIAKLVAVVAQAVHYAHQRGILHRDLKPSNILLDLQRQPHVTDFGLAKRVGEPPRPVPTDGIRTSPTPMTHTGLAVGTPSYMAPEQAFGSARALTTAADIYSLGAILYELLTGRPPFKAENPLDTLLEVMEREPVPVRAINRRVDRDLETICLKCLEKDPSRRYPSAHALANDLQRYLDHEPILARPVGALERFWRGCRRKPIVTLLAVALLLAVVGGFALVSWQWRKASANFHEAEQQRAQAEDNFKEAAFQRAQAEVHLKTAQDHLAEAERQKKKYDESFRLAHKAVNDFGMRVSDRELRQIPGMEPLRKELLKEVLAYLQEFLNQRGNDPTLRADQAMALFRIGAITGDIGARPEALASYERALTILVGLRKDHPNNARLEADIARTYNRIGIHQAEMGQPAALPSYQTAKELLEKLCAAAPADLAIHQDLAAVCNNLGNLHRDVGRLDLALACHLQDQSVQEKLVKDHPNDPDVHRQMASSCCNLASLYDSLNRRKEALELYGKAHATFRRLVDKHPNNLRYQNHLAHTYRLIGSDLANNGKPGDGLKMLKEGHALMEKLVRVNPNFTQYQSDLAASFRQMGHTHREMKQLDDALACYHESRLLQEKLVNLDATVSEFQNDLAKCHFDISTVLMRRSQRLEASRELQKAVEIREKLVHANPDHLGFRYDLALTLGNLGLVLAEMNRYDEGLASLRQAIDHQKKVVDRAPQVLSHARSLRRHHGNLVSLQRNAEQRAEVLRGLERKRAEQEEAVRLDPVTAQLQSDLAASYRQIAQFHRESHQLEPALASYRKAQVLLEKLTADHPDVARYPHELGSVFFNQATFLAINGQREEERKAYLQACEVREKLLKSHPDHVDNQSDLGTTHNNLAQTLLALGRREEALTHLHQAIEHQKAALTKVPQSGHYRRGLSIHYAGLADVQRQLGKPSEAVALTQERIKLWPGNGPEMYRGAVELALAAEVVGKGKPQLSPSEQEERLRYANLAVEVLRQAVSSGYREGQRIEKEPAFNLLRAREDFQKVLADLKK